MPSHHFIYHLMFLPHSSQSSLYLLTFLDICINSKSIPFSFFQFNRCGYYGLPKFCHIIVFARNALLDLESASGIYSNNLLNLWSPQGVCGSRSWEMGPGGGIWVIDILKCVVLLHYVLIHRPRAIRTKDYGLKLMKAWGK